MAVEIALDANNDEMSALLMSRMLNEKVRALFTTDDEDDLSRYRLAELVANGNMKKTVLKVLDSCVNPDIPFLKQYKEDDTEEEVWAKLPRVPLRYNFFFEILDGDYEGDYIGEVEGKYMDPSYFNITSPSPLQMITLCVDEASVDKDPIRHMVVRQLVRKKWEDYGKYVVAGKAGIYLLYLLVLSLWLFFSANIEQSDKSKGYFKESLIVFEVIAVTMTTIYLLIELVQLGKEVYTKCSGKFGVYLPWTNVAEFSTIIYILSLIGIISILPLQICGYLIPARSIATVTYLIVFLRLSDYFPLNMDFGTYTNTFKDIVKVDIKRFIVIIAFVVLAFSGSIYMAFAASGSFKGDITNFWHVLLAEMRAIFEGKELADSYAEYHVLLTLLVLLSMFSIIIVMGNVLIGQISERYTEAKGLASIQYDIDKANLLVGIERSVFPFFHNRRRKCFRKGLYVSNQDLISDLLQDWKTYFSEDDSTVNNVKDLVDKKILKKIK